MAAGADVLLDDRDERAGVLLNDSELLGIPHRIVIGDRALKEGNVEYAERRDNQAQAVAVSEVVSKILADIERLKSFSIMKMAVLKPIILVSDGLFLF